MSTNQPLNHIAGNEALRFHILNAIYSRRVQRVLAKPGVGKTDITQDIANWLGKNHHPDMTDAMVKAVCDERGLPVEKYVPKIHTFYVSQYEDIDFMPMPFVHPMTGEFQYKTPPLLENIMAGDVVIWEEATMIGCNRIMLQSTAGPRMAIGGWTAPAGVSQIMVGNDADSGNFSFVDNPVLGNRTPTSVWMPSDVDWVNEYAVPNALHGMVIAMVRMEGLPFLLNYDSKRSRNTTPRSLTYASDEMLVAEERTAGTLTNSRRMEILAKYLPDEAALKIQSLFGLLDKLVPFSAVVGQPDTAPVPDNPAALFMTLANIGRRTTPNEWAEVMRYVARLPLEFQSSIVEPVIKEHSVLTSTDEFQNYVIRTAALNVS